MDMTGKKHTNITKTAQNQIPANLNQIIIDVEAFLFLVMIWLVAEPFQPRLRFWADPALLCAAHPLTAFQMNCSFCLSCIASIQT